MGLTPPWDTRHSVLSPLHTDSDDAATPLDGQALVYDAGTQTWGPGTVGDLATHEADTTDVHGFENTEFVEASARVYAFAAFR